MQDECKDIKFFNSNSGKKLFKLNALEFLHHIRV